jgi:hypothetical protein
MLEDVGNEDRVSSICRQVSMCDICTRQGPDVKGMSIENNYVASANARLFARRAGGGRGGV